MLAPSDKDPSIPDHGQRRDDASEIVAQISSLLAAHQDTGLDEPLDTARSLCSLLTVHTLPGPNPPAADGDPDHVDRWPSNLSTILYGDVLRASFHRDQNLDTLYEAIGCYEGIAVSDPTLSRRLALGHGCALASMYDQAPTLEHANKAIRLLNSVMVEDADDELAAYALSHLAPFTFQVTWDGEGGHSVTADDSATADDYASRIDIMLQPHKSWGAYVRIKLLLARTMAATRVSIRRSDLKAGDDWRRFGRATLDACPPNHFLLPEAYSNLVGFHDWRHQLVGDPQDLQHTISLASRGLESCSPTSAMRYTLLDAKARGLGTQAQATGNTNLLDDAIKLSREALHQCPSMHRRYQEHVNGLMFLLGTHFESTGRIEFLDEIISFADLPLVTKCQWIACNVAEAMRHRARLASTGAAYTLLQRAIGILNARSEHSSNIFNPEKATINHGLGAVYDLQVELGMDIDQESRLQLARDAVSWSGDAFDVRTENAIGLVTVLLNHSLRTPSTSLVNEAEQIIQDTLKDTRLPDRLRASLTALNAELVVVRASTPTHVDLSNTLPGAWQMFEAVVADTSVRPRDRLRIAIRWADLAEDIDKRSALLAYRHAVEILPQIGYIGEDLMGRVQALRQARDLAPRAISSALDIGEVKLAIELMEQSRGVLWQQSHYLRPPLHLLPAQFACQLAEISNTLDSGETTSTERRQAAESFQSIVREVRNEPGCESFLLPRTYDQLVGELPEGYFVWLIPQRAHCDVVIVDSQARAEPIHFRHAGLDLDRLQTIARAFTTMHAHALRLVDRKAQPAPLLTINGVSQNHELLLEELWTNLVQTVLRTLNIDSKRSEDRPRLWWCPTGPLTFLPLHAAGIYQGSGQECAANYVVSSYLPTVTSLANACKASPSDTPSHSDRTQVLLVAQPEAQGLSRLPYAQEEAAVVRSIVPEDAIISLETVDPAGDSMAESVLARLSEATILHLACHATQCRDDPLQSGFDLVDGRLTLRELMRIRHPRAQLAYLSACESAAVDGNQPDEAINLAATMLFVGFKSVIDTMWSMSDIDGPFVAERIYKRVFRGGTLDLDLVPYALDSAIEELRQRGVEASRWATFVHIGK